MVLVPVDTPVTMPVVMSTVATAVLLLTHVPPETESVNAAVVPAHITVGTVIAGGTAPTSTLATQVKYPLKRAEGQPKS
jgi:hypothetical protein